VIFPSSDDPEKIEKVTSLSVCLGLRCTPGVQVPGIEECENYWHRIRES